MAVPQPASPRWPLLAVLVAGGVVGCLARYYVMEVLPTPVGGWPTGTFTVNLIGCLALGFLLEHLGHRGPDVGPRRLVRVGLGTGVLGTFTTYSTLAVEIDLLVRDREPGLAVGYATASVLGGLLVMTVGISVAAALADRDSQPGTST